MTTYEGEFKPPALAASSTPFPIAGRGRCEVSAAGLTLHGFRASVGRAVLMAVASGLVSGGGALLVYVLLLPSMTLETVALVVILGTVTGAAYPQKARKDHPLTLTIPWTSIRKVGRDKTRKLPQRVTILVKKSKPKGMIHFDVEGDADLLAADLQARI
jgi:hypothetical protein